jgi:hypothetical protein
MPVIGDLPGNRRHRPGGRLEQGRLGGAVRPDDRDEPNLLDRERDVRERDQPAISELGPSTLSTPRTLPSWDHDRSVSWRTMMGLGQPRRCAACLPLLPPCYSIFARCYPIFCALLCLGARHQIAVLST